MSIKLTRSIWMVAGLIMTLALSAGVILAQDEAVEAASSSNNSIGMVIAIFGLGVLVVFGLGAAMNAQQSEDSSSES